MSHLVALCAPDGVPGQLVDREERLILSAATDKNEISIDDRRGGILPANRLGLVFPDEVYGPEVAAVFGIETVKRQAAIEDVNSIPVTGGRCPWSVTTLVVSGTAVSSAIVLRDVQNLAPEFFSRVTIEGEADFAIHPVNFLHDDREGSPLGHGEGRKPEACWLFPYGLHTSAWPSGDVKFFRGRSVEIRAAILRPVSGLSGRCADCQCECDESVLKRPFLHESN